MTSARAAVLCVLTTIFLSFQVFSEAQAQDPDYVLSISDAEDYADQTTGVAVTLFSSGSAVSGFQFAVCDDSLVETVITDIGLGSSVQDRDLDKFAVEVADDSWSVVAVLTTGTTLPADATHELMIATYTLLESGESELAFCDSVLEPLVTTDGGEDVEPTIHSGVITILGATTYLRGDVNADGRVEPLLDALYLCAYAFYSGDAPPCLDAADIDDNEAISALSDSFYLLKYWFKGGPDVAFPGTVTCDSEPGGGDLGCESAAPCPSDSPTLVTDSSVVLSFGATLDEVEVGEFVVLPILLTVSDDPIRGIQFGVCHERGIVFPDPASPVSDIEHVGGVDSYAFVGVAAYESGWTAGILTSPYGTVEIEPGEYEFFDVTYSVLEEGSWTIEFCDGLGDPPVDVRAVRDLELILPEQGPARVIEGIPAPPPFTFGVEIPLLTYQPDEIPADLSFSVDLTIEEDLGNSGFPTETSGFAMGIKHDSSVLELVSAETTGVVAALNGGIGPDLVAINLDPAGGLEGLTAGVIFSFEGVTLQFSETEPVLHVGYAMTVDALAALEGDDDGSITHLEWSNELGDAVVTNVVKIPSGSKDIDVAPGLENGTVRIIPEGVLLPFLRGDCNGNGDVSALSDGVFLLRYGFLNGDAPPCLDAADVDDSGSVSALTDAVYLLRWGFSGGTEPPTPGALKCGVDSSEDSTNCETPSDGCE